MTTRLASVGALVLALVLGAGRLQGADFLRGDANSDGTVSIADAYFLVAHLMFGGWYPECKDAGDANDDGRLMISDAIAILSTLGLGDPLPEPFPGAGGDPTPQTSLGCESYGSGAPVEIERAEIRILDAVAAGGEDGRVTITVALSNSVPIAGFSGRIWAGSPVGDYAGDEPGTAGRADKARMLIETSSTAPSYVHVADGYIGFGFLAGLTHPDTIPAGDQISVLALDGCLREGTPAGEYPLSLEAGEMVSYRYEDYRTTSGDAIVTELVSGTLTVLEDVAEGSGCTSEVPGECVPVIWVRPHEIDARFELADGVAPPGATVRVPLMMEANGPIQGYSVSVDFDEAVLQATDVAQSFAKPDGSAYGFWAAHLNNDNNTPGNAGVDEGTVTVAAVFSFTDNCNNIPAGVSQEALAIHFAVNPGAPAGTTELRFLDGGASAGQPVTNYLTAFSETVRPDVANSFLLVNGRINVLPDGAVFIRGDANGDRAVEMSDAVTTLGYLFLGTEALYCPDAADANDDGILNVADPVATLQFLFLGGEPLPSPTGEPGDDPTPDALGCFFPEP
jgi:hypothetical protein